MSDKIAVVTGGGGSIGAASARRLSQNGYKIVLIDINKERTEQIGKELGALAVYAPCNVAELEEVRRAIEDIESRFGAITVLVNTAGGAQGLGFSKKLYWEIPLEERETLLKVNLYSTLNACYAVLPGMVKRRQGAIVNIASGQGLKGGPGLATYSAAKGGIVTFTQAIAVEAGPYGVRVNSIAPGGVQSAWRIHETAEQRARVEAKVPLGRRTSPEDVAGAVAYLVSADASHVTGACLDVSGGTSLH